MNGQISTHHRALSNDVYRRNSLNQMAFIIATPQSAEKRTTSSPSPISSLPCRHQGRKDPDGVFHPTPGSFRHAAARMTT